jgi:YesN/AraC family two-component response regulator
MAESAVPVRTGEKLIGFLHTGQVFRSKPTAARFDRSAKFVATLGIEADVSELREAYFATPVVPVSQYAGSVNLLSIFAAQLSLLATQVVEQERLAEAPVITRAKQFMAEKYQEDISLSDVARHCHTSTFYFCKLFKRETGVNFTEYLSSVRIEKAKNLLLNRDLHVGEIGYEVGFQSLTHFNRVFKKTVGESPTEYREKLQVRAA